LLLLLSITYFASIRDLAFLVRGRQQGQLGSQPAAAC